MRISSPRFRLIFRILGLISIILMTALIIANSINSERIARLMASPQTPSLCEEKEEEKFLFFELFASKFGGGVGNFMFEYISLLGIAKQLNRTPAVPFSDEILINVLAKKRTQMPYLLDGVIVKNMMNEHKIDVPYIGCCKFHEDVETLFEPAENETNAFSTFHYLQSFRYFDNLDQTEIWRRITFINEHRTIAEHQLLNRTLISDTHNICVHIRRGDYINSTLHEHSRADFTRGGVKHIVEKAKKKIGTKRKISVIMLGNDYEWQKTLFENETIDYPVHSVAQNQEWPSHIDWIFSQTYCDNVLLTASASTYGWWLAYLSRGQDVFYNWKYSKPNGVENEMTVETFFPPKWRPLFMKSPHKVAEMKIGR